MGCGAWPPGTQTAAGRVLGAPKVLASLPRPSTCRISGSTFSIMTPPHSNSARPTLNIRWRAQQESTRDPVRKGLFQASLHSWCREGRGDRQWPLPPHWASCSFGARVPPLPLAPSGAQSTAPALSSRPCLPFQAPWHTSALRGRAGPGGACCRVTVESESVGRDHFSSLIL